jgi:hypothetical protein
MITEVVDLLAAIAPTYPMVLPEHPTYPCIVYQQITHPRALAHDGPAGLDWPRVQLTCYASSYAGARELADEVRDLDGTTGTDFRLLSVENETDGYSDSAQVFALIVDIRIWY